MKNFFKLIPVLLTTISLIYIIRTLDIDTYKISFNSIYDLFISVIIGLLIVSLQNFLVAKRWYLITNSFKGILNLKHLFYAISYSSFLNQFLPSSIAGDAFRSYFQKQSGATLYRGISTVFVDRVIGYISLFLMASLFILFIPLNPIYHTLSIVSLSSITFIFFSHSINI
tara:strand:+ start:5304 stop:5813 length:510 start_codon:yes stop_codon:yes gene_type:complete